MKSILKVFLMCNFVIQFIPSIAQSFPESFIGCWQGKLTIYNYGNKTGAQIDMGLRINTTDTPGKYQWVIIYQDSVKDYRPYFLYTIDSAKGHYQTDEGNGIKLDDYFIGNKLVSRFTVQNTELICIYFLEQKKLVFEVFSNSSLNSVKSGLGTADIPFVYCFGPMNYQRAELSPCQ